MTPQKQSYDGKFIALSADFKKIRKSTNHLVGKNKSKLNSKLTNWQEIIKIRAETNEIEGKKTIQIVTESKDRFFEKTNKIDRPLIQLTKRKRGSMYKEKNI